MRRCARQGRPRTSRSKRDPDDKTAAGLRAGPIRLTVLAILGGGLTGLVAAVFRLGLGLGAGWAEQARAAAEPFGYGQAVSVLLAAGLVGLATWAVARFSPETAGSGIPHVEAVMEGKAPPGGLRLLAVKVAGGSFAMVGGLALGREGPSELAGTRLRSVKGVPSARPGQARSDMSGRSQASDTASA